jgi:hypothetical protein
MFWQMEEDINGRQTHCFELEDDLNFLIGRLDQLATACPEPGTTQPQLVMYIY